MVDSHCHIDQFEDPLAEALEAERLGIETVAVTSVPSHYRAGLTHLEGFVHVHLALGLHPLAASNHATEVDDFVALARNVLFIGEVGLDFSKAGWGTRHAQVDVFRRVVSSLAGRQHFVTVHSRQAEGTVLDVLAEYGVGPVVFHWFTGTSAIMKKVLEAGHYIGVNPAMTASETGHSVMGSCPRDRVITETDGPYAKCGNVTCRPRDVAIVLRCLAAHWQVKQDIAEATVDANFRRLAVGEHMTSPRLAAPT